MATWVLAFDVEKSGELENHHVIGIGASVVDQNLVELDKLFLPGHVEGKTNFDPKCTKEFWSKYPDQLKELEYKGDLTFEDRQGEMIKLFQAFRCKWEDEAEKCNATLVLVSDNKAGDTEAINRLINKYTDYQPLPCDTKGVYGAYWETYSMQKGFIMAINPAYKYDWGFTKYISKRYDVPPKAKEYNHNHANDAYNIAFDQQVLYLIRDGRIKKR